jgi:hypothetical protein
MRGVSPATKSQQSSLMPIPADFWPRPSRPAITMTPAPGEGAIGSVRRLAPACIRRTLAPALLTTSWAGKNLNPPSKSKPRRWSIPSPHQSAAGPTSSSPISTDCSPTANSPRRRKPAGASVFPPMDLARFACFPSPLAVRISPRPGITAASAALCPRSIKAWSCGWSASSAPLRFYNL